MNAEARGDVVTPGVKSGQPHEVGTGSVICVPTQTNPQKVIHQRLPGPCESSPYCVCFKLLQTHPVFLFTEHEIGCCR